MTALLYLVWLRLTEQSKKMWYLATTLATVVLAWIVLSTFSSPSLLSSSKAIEARLVIDNARVRAEFPVRYISRIQQIPGADDMYWSTGAAFFCSDGSGTTVTVYGWDGNYDGELRKKGASETDIAAWHATGNGALVGPTTAKHCGLPAGVTVSPDNIFGNGELPLHVVAVLPERGGRYDLGVHAHYDYINGMMDGNLGTPVRDMVARAIVNVANPSKLDQIAQAIEQEFLSSDPPLKVTVASEAHSLLNRFGQVQALLLLIIGVLALCVLLVFIAITAHLISQRRANMAMLQTLGFSRRIQFFGLALELSSVIISGAVFGIAAGYAALALLTPWAVNTLFTPALRPVDGAILVVLPALLLLLISTLIWPAVQMAKLKPVDYLRF